MRSARARKTYERILVRCPNWLGDVVMATPGFRVLRKTFPAAEIVGVLPSALAPVLAGSTDFDAVWSFEANVSASRRRLIERIRGARFDLGIAIPESISSAWMMRRGRVRHVVGFARDPLRRALLHEEIPAPSSWGKRRLVSKEHFVLRLMSAIGAHSDDARLELTVTEAERSDLEAIVRGRVAAESIALSASVVVVAPGASFGDAKCWPTRSYAALSDELVRRGYRVVFVGTGGERERVAAVAGAMTRDALNLAGRLGLGELKALVAEASAVVANDAGCRHVATALGVPSLVFFGPTSVEKTSANLATVEALETEFACRPCYERSCPIDHRCMTAIEVGEALAAFDRLPLKVGRAVAAQSALCGEFANSVREATA